MPTSLIFGRAQSFSMKWISDRQRPVAFSLMRISFGPVYRDFSIIAHRLSRGQRRYAGVGHTDLRYRYLLHLDIEVWAFILAHYRVSSVAVTLWSQYTDQLPSTPLGCRKMVHSWLAVIVRFRDGQQAGTLRGTRDVYRDRDRLPRSHIKPFLREGRGAPSFV